MSNHDLLRLTPAGLFCEAGGFFVDPWGPVDRAVITHAHADHARRGSRRYLTAADGARVLRDRLGDDVAIDAMEYGERLSVNGVQVSLHPAGHILGSAQVRVEYRGEVWVISGDYKVAADRTCRAWEPVECDTFVTESTFGLPIYRWQPQGVIFEEVNAWWRGNQAAGKGSVLLGYGLGKAQRLIAGVDPAIGPIYTHGAVESMNAAYRATGIELPRTTHVAEAPPRTDWKRALIVAPPSVQGSAWMRKFGSVSTAFASGWMCVRGTRRRRGVDRGFVLSDHVDWPDLLRAIRATGAGRVLVTHGYVAPMVRWLNENGWEGRSLETRFTGDEDEIADGAEPELETESQVSGVVLPEPFPE